MFNYIPLPPSISKTQFIKFSNSKKLTTISDWTTDLMESSTTNLDRSGDRSLILSHNSSRTPDENLVPYEIATVPAGEHATNSADATTDSAAEPSRKRPRGRPPGSKNKPKPPPIDPSNSNSNNPLSCQQMVVSAGADVAASLVAYARERHCGIAILHATGYIAGALKLRNTPPTFGQFEILSIRGTILPDENRPEIALQVALTPMRVYLGGTVEGPLVASRKVVVTVITFSITPMVRLPVIVPDGQNSGQVSGSGYNPIVLSLGVANWLNGGGHAVCGNGEQ